MVQAIATPAKGCFPCLGLRGLFGRGSANVGCAEVGGAGVIIASFHLYERVFKSLILKIIANIEIRHLQQLDGLLQLWGHDKRLLLLDLERWHHLHFVLPCFALLRG